MNLHVTSLTIEVTRRCNMLCEHCLRGNAEQKDMSLDMINRIFDQFAGVYDIVPTGGEPFLAPDQTALVLQRAGNTASSYLIVTNGTVSPFSDAGRKVMAQLAEFRGVEECAGICVSRDRFHDEVDLKPWEMISIAKFDEGEFPVIKRGRALVSGVGERIQKHRVLNYECFGAQSDIQIENLYVNVNGDVFADYDLSYEEMAKPEYLFDRVYLGHISRIHDTMEAIVCEDYPEYAAFRESQVA